MTYARRPMGDYKTYGYAGDPGFLSGLWGVIKKVAPTIIGAAIGGPVGGIIATAGTGGQARAKPKALPAPPGAIAGQISFPGGTSIGLGLQAPGAQVLGPYDPSRGTGMVPSGYHYAKDGSGRLVRNRRMNVANPRALRRAMRRAQGFEKLAKRAINFNKRVRPARRKTC